MRIGLGLVLADRRRRGGRAAQSIRVPDAGAVVWAADIPSVGILLPASPMIIWAADPPEAPYGILMPSSPITVWAADPPTIGLSMPASPVMFWAADAPTLAVPSTDEFALLLGLRWTP